MLWFLLRRFVAGGEPGLLPRPVPMSGAPGCHDAATNPRVIIIRVEAGAGSHETGTHRPKARPPTMRRLLLCAAAAALLLPAARPFHLPAPVELDYGG